MRTTINLALVAALTFYIWAFFKESVDQKNRDADAQCFFQKMIGETRADLLRKFHDGRITFRKLSPQSTEPVDNCVKAPR